MCVLGESVITTNYRFYRLALSALLFVVSSTAALAGPFHKQTKIDFIGSTGTVTYDEAIGGTLDAQSNISQVIALPGNSPYNIVGGQMNIQTGGCDVGARCYTSNGVQELVLGFSNSSLTGITITGSVYGPKGNLLVSGLLMSGELVDTGAVIRGSNVSMKNCTASAHAKGMCGPDTGGLNAEILASYVNLTLLKDLGLLPGNTSNAGKSVEQLNFILSATGPVAFGANGVMTGSIDLTDISVTPTPEAGTLLLFSSSFVVAAWFLRRKLSARST
jgi:hypothetical protein